MLGSQWLIPSGMKHAAMLLDVELAGEWAILMVGGLVTFEMEIRENIARTTARERAIACQL